MEFLQTFFIALFSALAQGAPYIILGYLFAAVIKEFVPVRVMAQQFGNKGVLPVLKAASVGALLPICSCGTISLGVGAHKCGTARGTTLAFMTSAPTVSPVMVLLSLSLLGATFTFTFVAVALVGAILLGYIGNWLLSGDRGAGELKEDEQIPEATRGGFFPKIKGAFRWAFWDLGSDVSVDLLIGLSIAAAVIAFLPMEWIAQWLGKQHLATLFYVILIGIPVYTCSVPSVPVVQSLLLMGMSPGAAVAYLLAGPATNLGELNAIRAAMGMRTAVFYTAGLFVIAMAGGLITDHFVYSNYQYKAERVAGAVHVQECCVPLIFGGETRSAAIETGYKNVPAWHYPFIVALGITLLLGLGRRAYAAYERFSKPAVPTVQETPPTTPPSAIEGMAK